MVRQWCSSSLFKSILAIALVSLAGFAGATVIMAGTRVIYNAKSQGQTLQFTNHDSGPSVMQIWVDSGDEHSTPETAKAPFVVNPPIFRIEPNAGQSVRLLFTGNGLPADRESVFYLNTLQIPSLSAANSGHNQMVVMVRSRLKIFYRPETIEGSPDHAIEKLTFHVSGEGKDKHVAASNASGFNVSVANGTLFCGAHSATLKAVMIAPLAETALKLQGHCPLDAAAIRVKLRYVDDYGAIRDAEYPVAASNTK